MSSRSPRFSKPSTKTTNNERSAKPQVHVLKRDSFSGPGSGCSRFNLGGSPKLESHSPPRLGRVVLLPRLLLRLLRHRALRRSRIQVLRLMGRASLCLCPEKSLAARISEVAQAVLPAVSQTVLSASASPDSPAALFRESSLT